MISLATLCTIPDHKGSRFYDGKTLHCDACTREGAGK